jgi:hypothetical protein
MNGLHPHLAQATRSHYKGAQGRAGHGVSNSFKTNTSMTPSALNIMLRFGGMQHRHCTVSFAFRIMTEVRF